MKLDKNHYEFLRSKSLKGKVYLMLSSFKLFLCLISFKNIVYYDN